MPSRPFAISSRLICAFARFVIGRRGGYGHIFLCMLAYYVQWHLRQTWAPYLLEDQHPGQHADDSVVRPALRSASALAKAHTKRTLNGEDVHSFSTLLAQHVRTQTLKQVRDRTCRREFPGDTKRL